MNTNINCPVCSYQEITGDTCPNCDTDLGVIRMLQKLPPGQTLPQPVKFAAWSLRIALLMLIIGIGLGVGINKTFLQPQLNTVVFSYPSPVSSSRERPKPPTNPAPVLPQKPPAPTAYSVKPGDHLSAIALKLCGKKTSWQLMVKANPQLKGRENDIDVGEVFKIPNCQEGI
ncbi:MAG: LysM peptidoglycan-binding domain-containing protein [Stigonema ocellatum SAG 48.90 = DSM 106950]|nr:LysM peptidoglycan-binding domain-containing protein [Stigonema ocellatum SAG 48.90 = DSM 106950]